MNINMDDYMIIDTKKNTTGDTISKIVSFDDHGKLIIKQYTGINTDNFLITKHDGKRISFSFFTMNGIYYINLNGEHVMDYNKFIRIKKISYNTNDNILKISHTHFGDIYIQNCDVIVFKKALHEMNVWMKNKKSILSNILYYIFTAQ